MLAELFGKFVGAWTIAILRCARLPLVALLHHGFGRVYVSLVSIVSFAVFGFFWMALFAGAGGSAIGALLTMALYGATLVAMIYHKIAAERAFRRGDVQFSDYPGFPWLGHVLPIGEFPIRTFVEPALVWSLGWVMVQLGIGGAGYWLMLAAAASFLREGLGWITRHKEDVKLADERLAIAERETRRSVQVANAWAQDTAQALAGQQGHGPRPGHGVTNHQAQMPSFATPLPSNPPPVQRRPQLPSSNGRAGELDPGLRDLLDDEEALGGPTLTADERRYLNATFALQKLLEGIGVAEPAYVIECIRKGLADTMEGLPSATGDAEVNALLAAIGKPEEMTAVADRLGQLVAGEAPMDPVRWRNHVAYLLALYLSEDGTKQFPGELGRMLHLANVTVEGGQVSQDNRRTLVNCASGVIEAEEAFYERHA